MTSHCVFHVLEKDDKLISKLADLTRYVSERRFEGQVRLENHWQVLT